MRALTLSFIAATAGCSTSARPGPVGSTEGRPRIAPFPDAVTPIALKDAASLLGVSGLDLQGTDAWLAPERTGALVRLRLGRERLSEARIFAVKGAPPGLDIEALAFLPQRPGHVALGTEARGDRNTDAILIAVVDPGAGRVHVVDRLAFSYRSFGIRAADNRGIEGLCAVDDILVAASEMVVRRAGQRWACVTRFTLEPDGKLRDRRALWVRLSSREGKLSALACRRRAGSLEAYAVERHFGVTRLVRFVVPEGSADDRTTPLEVTADVVIDLAPHLGPKAPNLEGLAWICPCATNPRAQPTGGFTPPPSVEDRLLAVSDNDYGSKTGPVRAFTIALARRTHALPPRRRED